MKFSRKIKRIAEFEFGGDLLYLQICFNQEGTAFPQEAGVPVGTEGFRAMMFPPVTAQRGKRHSQTSGKAGAVNVLSEIMFQATVYFLDPVWSRMSAFLSCHPRCKQQIAAEEINPVRIDVFLFELFLERVGFFQNESDVLHFSHGIFQIHETGHGQKPEGFGSIDKIKFIPFALRTVVHRFSGPLEQYAGCLDRIGFPSKDVISSPIQNEGKIAGVKGLENTISLRRKKTDGSDRGEQREPPGKRSQMSGLSVHVVDAFVHSIFLFHRV